MKRVLLALSALMCIGLATETAVAQADTDMKSVLGMLEKARDADMGADKASHLASALAALKKVPADKCGHRVMVVKHTDLAKLDIQANNAKSTKMEINDAIKRANLAINCKQS